MLIKSWDTPYNQCFGRRRASLMVSNIPGGHPNGPAVLFVSKLPADLRSRHACPLESWVFVIVAVEENAGGK